MRRRALSPSEDDGSGTTTYTITADAPKYDFLKNDTCILTPETSTGPYIYPRSQVLRQDIVEDQVGVPFVLDIGLMDIHTCEPLSNALVDIWVSSLYPGSSLSFTKLFDWHGSNWKSKCRSNLRNSSAMLVDRIVLSQAWIQISHFRTSTLKALVSNSPPKMRAKVIPQ